MLPYVLIALAAFAAGAINSIAGGGRFGTCAASSSNVLLVAADQVNQYAPGGAENGARVRTKSL